MTRIFRLFLALAVAFVFTGRMEAAAQHCARLVQADLAHADDIAVEAASDAHADMACHDEAASAHEAAPQPSHEPAHHQTSGACECIAVLKACTAIIKAKASARIEPYEWAEAEDIPFASIEPAPDFRPPRA